MDTPAPINIVFDGPPGSEGPRATQAHLADLRRLVFDDTRFKPTTQP